MKLLTPEEVGSLFKINVRQVKELARQGRIPAIKVGKFWRFPEDSLRDWMKKGEVPENDWDEINSIAGKIISEVS